MAVGSTSNNIKKTLGSSGTSQAKTGATGRAPSTEVICAGDRNPMNQDVVSFVLRFVREMGEDQPARWRGVIKHVQGNSESQFTQFAEALAFMQTRVNELIETSFGETAAVNDANPFTETARLWGEFMPRYTRLMADTMSEAMSGSSQLSEQMEKAMVDAMALWGMPSLDDQKQTDATLATITVQVEQLQTKIEQLEQRYGERMKQAEARPEKKDPLS
jgi:hypothetical protein